MPSVTLAIDTAGPVVGVAAWDGARAFARSLRLTRGTEEQLLALAEAVLGEAGAALPDVTGIGVAVGPGAFTGLRVGVATAGGLAMALGVPVWPAPSLVPRAHAAGFGGDVLVMLDARKGRVYAAHYHVTDLVHPPADIAPSAALAWVVGRPFRAVGEGACVYRAEVEAQGGVVVDRADDPGTGELARLAAAAIERGEGVDPLALRTDYLREPDAVRRA
jgi:tRNA threonylcarbamoyladenosine biosynthesis protein TsaB